MTRLKMTTEQYRAVGKRIGAKPIGQSKYHNIKVVFDNITFDSKAEGRRYLELKLLQQSGAISGFARQPSFLIAADIRYRPDFIVCDKTGQIWVEDVKGHETKEFIIKAKLFNEKYPWLPLRIIK